MQGGKQVERNRRKAALISLEQITSISAPETGGNLPDRELRARDLEPQWRRRKREREVGGPERPLQFSGGQLLHARKHQPITYQESGSSVLFISAE